ncbi:MAG: Gfo/Idh/MocA family oxidoreductase [Lachnospiraceae bacterium]|nr:Gfo/Idh/MocA family oxidoreductase [Lachnospiraceae bacterium]
MNAKGEVCLGVAGAGRATELHMNALKRFGGIPVCYKHIMARRFEQVQTMKDRYGFINASLDFEDLLNDPEIDVIDICTPPYVHEDMVERAMRAGKHVICEKPLSGYFGEEGDVEPIGKNVSKVKMYDKVLENLNRLRATVEASDTMFMYAENFVYAPAVVKASEIIQKKKSRILFAKGEESLKGSSSPVAGEWNRTGGGTFIRTGAHPLTAILWLKSIESQTREEEIRVESVYADMETITNQLSEYEHRHIAARPHDVEDFGAVVLTFSDKTKAMIMATDTLLGGSKNYVELYCNDAVINCRLTMANFMETYFLDEDNLEDVYISEMLPQKTGWNYPFLEDEIIRGYTDEMRDFIESIYFHRTPKSGFDLAYDTVRVIYAAYKSAELKRPIEL